MSDIFFGITWQHPSYLAWYIPLALCIVAVSLRIHKVIKRLSGEANTKALLKNISTARVRLRMLLLLAGALAMVLAFMRPQWDKVDETVIQEGRDVIIALDISRSMLAQDVHPNRLEYAKQKIRKFIHELGPERIGLLVFSGEAVMQCPLTTDFTAFFLFLDALSVESISSGTTSLGSALEKVLGTFSQFPTERTKLVALFTDGEDFTHDFSTTKQRAIDANVHIFTVGIGSTHGAPIPLYDENGSMQGHQQDENGAIVVSRLNAELGKQLAQETGGKYVQATADDTDLYALKNWIENFEKTKFDEQTVLKLHEKFYWYSGISFLLLLVELLV